MSTQPADARPVAPAVAFTRLGEVLDRWRRENPGALALVDDTRPVTVGELAGLVDAQIAALNRHSRPGARIGVHAANSAAFVAALYAVPASGRVLVPLNVRLTDAEAADQLRRADAALLLGDPIAGFDGPIRPLEGFGTLDGDGASDGTAGGGTSEPDPTAPAWIIFTSGSTGRPKGVLVTHASLAAAVATTAAARPLADDDVYLYPFPLFHVAAYNVVHAHARRRPVVLPPRFDARRIIELCHTHRVTAMSLAATMLRMLLDVLGEDTDLTPPPSLRTIAYGAAPMPAVLLREAHDVLGCDFAQGYGSTELSGNAVFLGPDAHRRGLAGETRLLSAAGYAGPGVELRIVDDSGSDVDPGVPGEILVAAAQVCAGYLDDRRATETAIGDGWLHTGDIGTLADDGLLTIVDRAKDIVVTGGENVASREVEDALRTHPLVADVAIVGLPDAHWGEAVTAVIVPSDDPPAVTDGPFGAPDDLAHALRSHVAARLAGYKKPRRVFLIGALPTNANGKVDKPALRALLTESPGRTVEP